jgi:hypothetical protein
MKLLIRSLVHAVVVSAAACMFADPASTATVITCNPTKVKAVASVVEVSRGSNSATFAQIPEASVSFTQGGASASCVLVRFSAETFAEGNENTLIRAFLDGVTAGLPAEVQYSGTDNGQFSARSFEFIFPSVAPGAHVVRMQYRSRNGTFTKVLRHNTVVQFAP